jgi:hypothetical protein
VAVDEVTERLRRRYPPPRVPRWVKVAAVAVVAAVGIGWVIWAGLAHSRQPVEAQVASYVVPADTSIEIVLTVQRPDPSRAARCQVLAQSADLATVGEQSVMIPPGTAELQNLTVTLVTLRRAAGASVRDCALT